MVNVLLSLLNPFVALLAEGVDRNFVFTRCVFCGLVALLAEGVDRNYANDNDTLTTWVALLAEGVDRNQVPESIITH